MSNIFYISDVKLSNKFANSENLVYLSAGDFEIVKNHCSQTCESPLNTLPRIRVNGRLKKDDIISCMHFFIVELLSQKNDNDDSNTFSDIKNCQSISAVIASTELLCFLDQPNVILELDYNCEDFPRWYQIPSIAILHLYPDENAKVNTNSSISYEISISNAQQCLFGSYVTLSSDSHMKSSQVFIRFNNQTIVFNIDIDCDQPSNRADKTYLITLKSQIIVYHTYRYTKQLSKLYHGIQIFHPQYIVNNKPILKYIDETITTTLRGFIYSIKNDRKKVKSNLLILGESGEGAFSIAREAFSSEIVTIVVSARNGLFSSNYNPSIIVQEAYKCALLISSYRPCCVLFEDIHSIASINPSSSLNENVSSPAKIILKELSDYESKSQRCNYFTVACSYSSSLIDPSLVAVFQEKMIITSPSSSQRSIIASILCREAAVCNQNIFYTVSSYAETLSGKPLLAVLQLLTVYMKNSLINEPSVIENEVFTSVVGLQTVKQSIQESIIWPRKYPNIFRSFNISLDTGIMLYGPPGTGKTLLPRAIAQELNCTLVNVRSIEVVRGEVGTGEHALISLFHEAKRSSPSIVFIDEFQSIFTDRSANVSDGSDVGTTLSSTLASCMDDINDWNSYAGVRSHVIVMAATNEPWAIDKSFLRSGRFDKKIYVGLLDEQGRREYALRNIQKIIHDHGFDKNASIDSIVDKIVLMSDGFSGADMKYLFKKILHQLAIKHELHLDTYCDIDSLCDIVSNVLAESKPSTSLRDVEEYNKFTLSYK